MNLIKAEKTDKNLYTLEFSVDKETFSAAVTNSYHKKAKKINIPGFRPGKAPRNIIEKMYGKDFFYDDAINEVLPDAYEAAINEAEIDAVSRPEIDVLSAEDGVVFSAKVYVKPEVSIEGYKGIEVEKHIHAVTDQEIEAEIKAMQQRNSRQIDVTDRAAQEGDTANIDYEGFCDGVAFEGGKGENHPLVLGSGSFIPGFEDEVVGHAIGEEFDVNVTFPDDYNSTELSGKPAVFKCKLNSITKTEFPALDDEFAKDVSEFDTFLEYREDIKAKIQKRHEDEADTQVDNALSEALINKLVTDIPQPMFDAETDNFVRDYENRLRMQGLSLEMYMKYTGQSPADFRDQMRPQAEAQVKMRLALEKITQLENITASEDDINAEYERLRATYNMELDKVKELVDDKAIGKDMAVQKAMDFVRDNAIIKEAECNCDEEDEKQTSEKPEKSEKPKKAKKVNKDETKTEADAETTAEDKDRNKHKH